MSAEVGLPVRPAPRPGEALPAYLRRTADLNLMRPADLGWRFRDGRVLHDDLDWDQLSAATGQRTEDLRELTTFRYPAVVVGKTKPGVRRTRWRVVKQRRNCPRCREQGWQRDWDLALKLCCLPCRTLIRPFDDTTEYPRTPGGDKLLALQAELDAALVAAAKPAVRDRLSRLHRFVRLANLTADLHWPPTTSTYLEAFRTPRTRAWEDWTEATTPGDPITVAVLVTACWPATRTRRTQRDFLTTAWARVDARQLPLGSAMRRSLPRIPAAPPPRVQRRPDTGAVDAAAAELTAAGLTATNIPLLLMTSQEFLPPSHELRRRHHMAAGLAQALAGERHEPPDRAELKLGPTVSAGDPPRELELRPYVAALLSEQPVDYDQRRALLGSLPRTPPPRHANDWDLARAWIWVHLTRGPLLNGLHRIRLLDLVDYHRRMSPDERLRLQDLGEQHLAWPLELEQDVNSGLPVRATAREVS